MIFPTLVGYERAVGVSTWFSWLEYGQPSPFFHSPFIFAMSLFSDGIIAYKFFVIISFFLSGITSYFVASRLVKFPLSALTAGIVYMNSQFMFSQFFEGHIDIMFGYSLFPLAIYFAYSLFSASSTRIMLYSAFEVLFLFSSHLNITYIGGLAIVITIAFSAVIHRHLGAFQLFRKVILFSMIGASLSAFFLIPFLGGSRSLTLLTHQFLRNQPKQLPAGYTEASQEYQLKIAHYHLEKYLLFVSVCT
jgi:antibiotic biosynthesis monooxygenase (ABM) superfamily enzyme